MPVKHAALLVLTLVGCGSSTEASQAGDGGRVGAADAAPTFSGVTPIRFGDNATCASFALGLGCHVVLTGVTAGCTALGLSPAAPADVAAIEKALGTPPAPEACELAMLPASCAAAAMPGWCYMAGSCLVDAGITCEQSLCASAGFRRGQGYMSAWLTCP
jgi:hypothetical protein